MLHADYLFLLTDVDGLYTTNPRKDPSAKPIDVVESVQDIRAQVSTKTLGSKLGTGGMETKLIAAEIATATGVTTVISNSTHPERIVDIIDYNAHQRRSHSPPNLVEGIPRGSRTPSLEREGKGREREAFELNEPVESGASQALTPPPSASTSASPAAAASHTICTVRAKLRYCGSC